MLFVDLIEETFFAVLANKVRSSLTVLGIVIGIGSVVAMISIGQGATSEVSKNIQALGSNLLVVMPGSQMGVGMQVRGGMGSASSLILEDAEAIAEQVSDVVAVAPEVSTRKQVIVKGENTNTSIYGVTNSYTEVKNIEIETGSFISDQNITKSSKIAVLGPDTKDDLFGENVNPIGQTVKIENMNFTVVGVTKSKGGTGFGSSDDLIYIPLSTAQHYFTGSNSKAFPTSNFETGKTPPTLKMMGHAPGIPSPSQKTKKTAPAFLLSKTTGRGLSGPLFCGILAYLWS